MNDIAALQALLVGLVLLWAGYGKLLGRLAASRARRSALHRLVGERYAERAYRATGGVELIVGAALLLPPWWRPDAVAASVLAVGFLGYLGFARLAAPDSSCGCLGSVAVPVSPRSVARAVLLLAASGTASLADTGWITALGERPAAASTIVVAESAAVVALSPELDRWWLVPLRRLRVRLTHPLAGGTSHVPLESTVQQLLRSPAYRSVGASVRSDVHEHWDDGEWRFVTYAIAYDGRLATGVFAVPLLRYEPAAVRVAIVDEDTGETLYRPEIGALLAT